MPFRRSFHLARRLLRTGIGPSLCKQFKRAADGGRSAVWDVGVTPELSRVSRTASAPAEDRLCRSRLPTGLYYLRDVALARVKRCVFAGEGTACRLSYGAKAPLPDRRGSFRRGKWRFDGGLGCGGGEFGGGTCGDVRVGLSGNWISVPAFARTGLRGNDTGGREMVDVGTSTLHAVPNNPNNLSNNLWCGNW